jgi:hypothetical protein
MAMVFICYRRDDSAAIAGRIRDRLAKEFGDSRVFMDVDTIPLGSDFPKVLSDEVNKCKVLLVVIGKHWLEARDADGNRRLDSENDFVRIEIATALQRGIPVIPILVDGAKIPQADELPEDLKGLATRNGLDVRHGSFHVDMNRLIDELKANLGVATTTSVTTGYPQPPPLSVTQTVRRAFSQTQSIKVLPPMLGGNIALKLDNVATMRLHAPYSLNLVTLILDAVPVDVSVSHNKPGLSIDGAQGCVHRGTEVYTFDIDQNKRREVTVAGRTFILTLLEVRRLSMAGVANPLEYVFGISEK